jgi:hypothetical protein
MVLQQPHRSSVGPYPTRDRALVAQDWSAGAVRDRTGPKPAGTRWVHAQSAGRGLQRAPAVTTGAKEAQVRAPAQPHQAPLKAAGESSSLPTRLPRALRLLPTMHWSPRTGLTLWARLGAFAARRGASPFSRPCPRAISSGHRRYPAVNHGLSVRGIALGAGFRPGHSEQPETAWHASAHSSLYTVVL